MLHAGLDLSRRKIDVCLPTLQTTVGSLQTTVSAIQVTVIALNGQVNNAGGIKDDVNLLCGLPIVGGLCP